MAGLTPPAGTGRRNIDLLLRQKRQHRLALDAVLAEVQHLRHGAVRAVDFHFGEGSQPLAQLLVQGADGGVPALHVLRKAADRSGQPHRVGQVLGAGALLTLLLAAKVGRLERLCQTVAEVERPHALGRVDLVAAHRQCVDVGQLNGDPHPRLHRVHMDEGAAVLPLDLGGQALDLVPGADLVVDHHAGHEDGVPVHMRQHLVNVQRTVRAGGHDRDVIAHRSQTFQRLLHTGVFKTGHHDALAELPGQRRAQQGHVVALAAAGGEVQLPRFAAQAPGHHGAGRVQGFFAPGAGGVQGRRIRPVLPHGPVDDICHVRGHDGGGGVVQIMQFRILQHKIRFLLSLLAVGRAFRPEPTFSHNKPE